MTLSTVMKTEVEKNTTKNYLKDDVTNKMSQNQTKLSPYYDETVPKNDPNFFKSIRKWEKQMEFVTALRWINVCAIFLMHIVALTLFVYHVFFGNVMWKTMCYEMFIVGTIAAFGTTAGVHRYYTHRSYKAKLPLQILLLCCYSCAGQIPVYHWVRDHRLHHKKSETSADPHDANRGFFFAHVGWLMMKKHPHVIQEGMKINMTDITNDPLVQFHTRYFTFFKITFCFMLPILGAVFGLGETWLISVYSAFVRYVISLNCAWSVNSFAHLWGSKPYDPNIMPVENWTVSYMSLGEGWHNYHHTFPWDYKAAELPYFINSCTVILHVFAKLGWAYDMKKASPSLIKLAMENNRGLSKLSKSIDSQNEQNNTNNFTTRIIKYN